MKPFKPPPPADMGGGIGGNKESETAILIILIKKRTLAEPKLTQADPLRKRHQVGRMVHLDRFYFRAPQSDIYIYIKSHCPLLAAA